jgi:hypothetical protein
MRTSVFSSVLALVMLVGLGSSSMGCFIVNHNPVGTTTTTTGVYDGGARRAPRAVELNDLSQDAR